MSKASECRHISSLDEAELHSLIEDINDIFSGVKYKKAGLNSFLGDFIYIELILRRFNEDSLNNFFITNFPTLYFIGKFIFFSKLKSLKRPAKKIFYKGRYLFTWSNIKEYCALLVLPVVKKLPPHTVAIAGSTPEMASKLQKGIAFNIYDDLFYRYSIISWMRNISKIYRRISRTSDDLLLKYKLHKSFKTYMTSYLLTATQFYDSCLRVFKESSPKAIITEYDRNFNNSILISAGNTLRIPTYTFIHGVINDKYGYYPFIAKHIFCWGISQKELLISWGIDENKIFIAGNQKMKVEKLSSEELDNVKQRFTFDNKKSVIALTPNPILLNERLKLVETFCSGVSGIDEFNFCVKLHPSDKIVNYTGIVNKYPGIKFINSNEISFVELMNLVDVFVIHNSSIGIEALLYEKSLVVLDVLDTPLYNVEEIVDNGLAAIARSSEELQKVITEGLYRDLKSGPDIMNFVISKIINTGDAAADIIAEKLKNEL